ncbi:unnamed protein product [Diabrotica balteata]|uniref:Myb/SANT-like DNA-binding domain-containing protein n=1 Tax=Diabrotica balteata TaxID=107213 RepID=A0A9N9SNL6_DIABA|nr:unnamed protein product [Diabrotica balteata]
MAIVETKYKCSNAQHPKALNAAFYLYADNAKIRVRKTFFINTLGITSKMIRTVRYKTNNCNSVEEAGRGKNNSHRRVDDNLKEDIIRFINLIPRIETHYLRASTSREFISGPKSITDLFRDFQEKQKKFSRDPGKFDLFYEIFTTHFNLGVFQPKKDQCHLCLKLYVDSLREKNVDKIPSQSLYEKVLRRDLNLRFKPPQKDSSQTLNIEIKAAEENKDEATLKAKKLNQELHHRKVQLAHSQLNQDVNIDLPEYVTFENAVPGTSSEFPRGSIATSNTKVEYKWNENDSKLLLDLYLKLKSKVGTLEIKNAKVLWLRIAGELNSVGIPATPKNCLNRWRLLERNYKKFVDNQNKTARGRKYFEYEKEMDQIFGNKKNVNPEILLSSDTYHIIEEKKQDVDEDVCQNTEHIEEIPCTQTPKTPIKRLRNKNSELQKMRMDRANYYQERLVIEREKLEQLKRRNDDIERRTKIKEEKNMLIEAQNKLLEEKKNILKQAAKVP